MPIHPSITPTGPIKILAPLTDDEDGCWLVGFEADAVSTDGTAIKTAVPLGRVVWFDGIEDGSEVECEEGMASTMKETDQPPADILEFVRANLPD